VQLGSSGRVGTGCMVAKVEAAKFATGAGTPVLPHWPGARSARSSTRTGAGPSTRRLWLAHATTGRAQLELDAGAVEAVVGRRKSLLPAGVTG
jgi:glutamate 5-kinase